MFGGLIIVIYVSTSDVVDVVDLTDIFEAASALVSASILYDGVDVVADVIGAANVVADGVVVIDVVANGIFYDNGGV